MTDASTTPPTGEVGYFTGEFLATDDYAREQAYQIGMQRAGTAALDVSGVISGLSATISAGLVTVLPGIAIDASGRLVVQATQATIAAPDAKTPWLVARFSPAATPAGGDSPALVVDGAVLSWQASAPPAGDAGDDADAVLLAQYVPGSPPTIDNSVCRHVGVKAGTLTLKDPSTAATGAVATITGWNSSSDVDEQLSTGSGLRLEAATTVLTALDPGVGPVLSIRDGALSIGTMTTGAVVDVMGSNIAQRGPGTLTSFDRLVACNAQVLDLVAAGTVLMVAADRQGIPRQATVVNILSDQLVTDVPLNCENAPFTFIWGLIASVARLTASQEAAPVFCVDRTARVGFATASPRARTEVCGDLRLSGSDAGGGRIILFQGDGAITTAPERSAIAMQASVPQMEFRQQKAADPAPLYQWLPGQTGMLAVKPGASAGAGPPPPPPPPAGMAVSSGGLVTIGPVTTDAGGVEIALDIEGYVRSLTGPDGGGFIFPDGTVQTTAQTALPVGAVIDWYYAGTTVDIPDSYRVCDGATVNDSDSPFYGQPVPDLSSQFVVGTSQPWPIPASGPSQPIGQPLGGSFVHHHTYAFPGHEHAMAHAHPSPAPSFTDSQLSGSPTHGYATGGAVPGATVSHTHEFQNLSVVQSTAPLQTSTVVSAVTDDQTLLPPYMSLLKLIRIK